MMLNQNVLYPHSRDIGGAPRAARSKVRRRTLSLVALGALLSVSLACGDDEEVTTVAPVTKKKKVTTIEETPEAAKRRAEEMAYTYDAVNRRDPFKTYFDELILVDTDSKNLTELQRIELDKLKLVAVVTGTATPMAMVEDNTGRGHTIKIGTLIGKRFGQVKAIRRNEVVIQEEFRDFTGKRIPVYKSLKIDTNAKTAP